MTMVYQFFARVAVIALGTYFSFKIYFFGKIVKTSNLFYLPVSITTIFIFYLIFLLFKQPFVSGKASGILRFELKGLDDEKGATNKTI